MAATKAAKASASTSQKRTAAAATREEPASMDDDEIASTNGNAVTAARGVKRGRPKAAPADDEDEDEDDAVKTGKPRDKGKGRDVIGGESHDARPASKKSKQTKEDENDAADTLRQSQSGRSGGQSTLGASLSADINTNNAEVAIMQDKLDRIQNAYNALKVQFGALRDLRETGPEARLAELKQESDARVEAARAALKPYTAENQELKAEILNLKRQIMDLADLDPEERANAFKDSNGPTREEFEALQAENAELQQQLTRATKDRKAHKLERQHHSDEISRLQSDHALVVARLTDNHQAAMDKAGALEKELQQEMQNSQKLLAAGKPAGHNASRTTNGAATSDANSSALAFYKSAQELLADLIGVVLVNGPTSEAGKYDFIMSDPKKKRSLHFKLEQDDASTEKLVYAPELEPSRDKEMMLFLDETLKSNIKFDRDQLPYFFKRLWRAFHDPKKTAS